MIYCAEYIGGWDSYFRVTAFPKGNVVIPKLPGKLAPEYLAEHRIDYLNLWAFKRIFRFKTSEAPDMEGMFHIRWAPLDQYTAIHALISVRWTDVYDSVVGYWRTVCELSLTTQQIIEKDADKPPV